MPRRSPEKFACHHAGTIRPFSDIPATVYDLAEGCGYERPHACHIVRLTTRLFDALGAVHHLGPRQRQLARIAALLHDIGFTRSVRKHHKHSRDIILATPSLPLTPSERVTVALIARYHRAALPKEQHRYYRDLTEDDQRTVRLVAALVRLADGFDRTHRCGVRVRRVSVRPSGIALEVTARYDPAVDIEGAKEKADLLRMVSGCAVTIRTVPAGTSPRALSLPTHR